MECDNISTVHNPITLNEDMCAMRVMCKECHHHYIIRKNPWNGAPENKSYSKIFKRDVLQGNDNLFYKIHPEYLKI